jgi:hypothetical protein
MEWTPKSDGLVAEWMSPVESWRLDYRWFAYEQAENGIQKSTVRRCQSHGMEFWRPKLRIYKLCDGRWQEFNEDIFAGYELIGVSKVLATRSKRVYSYWASHRYIRQHIDIRLLSNKPIKESEIYWLCNLEGVVRYEIQHKFTPGDKIRIFSEARSSYSNMRGVYIGVLVTNEGYYARTVLDCAGLRTLYVNVPYDHLVPDV